MKRRDRRGSSFLELTIGLLVLIPIGVVLLDSFLNVLAVQLNNSVCQEAAHMAANGNPNEAQNRALAIINRANNKTTGTQSKVSLVSVQSTLTEQQLAEVATYGGPIKGSVTVQTEVKVPVIGAKIYNGQTSLAFRSTQTFPCTYVLPNTKGVISP